MQLCNQGGFTTTMNALIDTGSDINLIKRGLVPTSHLSPPGRQICILAANNMTFGGDHHQFKGWITVQGRPIPSHLQDTTNIPLTAYDADIDVDAILSYGWLATHGINVLPKDHGLDIPIPHGTLRVHGLPDDPSSYPHHLHRITKKHDPQGTGPDQIDNYQVRPSYYTEFCHRLKLTPTRDCFAREDDAQCHNYYTYNEDALRQE